MDVEPGCVVRISLRRLRTFMTIILADPAGRSDLTHTG